MHIREWRTRRIVALILGYWTALIAFLGVSCYRRLMATSALYQAQHPEDQNFLVIADSGCSQWVIVALVVLPPFALLTYRRWAKRRPAA